MRFPEFKGEWKTYKLKDICKFTKGKGISKNDITNEGTPCIRYGELYTHYDELIDETISKTKIPLENLILSEANDIIIPSTGETAIDISQASCIKRDNIAIGGDINILKTEQDGVFLSYYLNYIKNDVAKLAQGISVIHLYADQLKTLNVNIPSIEEQRKITELLLCINHKIDSLEKKSKLLKMYKKTALKEIFGNIDFKNVKILKDCCNIKTGKLNANAMEENGKYRFYTCAKEFYYINEYAYDTEALLISGNGAHVGYIHYYKGKFNAYQRTYVLNNFSENIFYIYHYLNYNLQKVIEREKNESNTPYIKLNTLSDIKIPLPKKELQQNLAYFFNDFNRKINLIEKDIDLNKKLKENLLLKMFCK